MRMRKSQSNSHSCTHTADSPRALIIIYRIITVNLLYFLSICGQVFAIEVCIFILYVDGLLERRSLRCKHCCCRSTTCVNTAGCVHCACASFPGSFRARALSRLRPNVRLRRCLKMWICHIYIFIYRFTNKYSQVKTNTNNSSHLVDFRFAFITDQSDVICNKMYD